jgi:hypothetical protein
MQSDNSTQIFCNGVEFITGCREKEMQSSLIRLSDVI